MNYAFLYGLSGYHYADLAGDYSAAAYVVDVDDSQLTAPQIAALQQQGSVVYSYLSIGEAESYRDYWQGWKPGKPAWVLKENPDWKGNYLVGFWQPEWQGIILSKLQAIVKMGYNGVYLDIVDAFSHPQVKAAYRGSDAELRREMERFVMAISQQAKAVNPDFKIIPQNAVDLASDPRNADFPNSAYLAAIDGMGVESLWYSDNDLSDWTKWDLQHIRHAQRAGKFVLATSYPTYKAAQRIFVDKALAQGMIPFVGHRSLAKKQPLYPINQQIAPQMPSNWQKHLR